MKKELRLIDEGVTGDGLKANMTKDGKKRYRLRKDMGRAGFSQIRARAIFGVLCKEKLIKNKHFNSI